MEQFIVKIRRILKIDKSKVWVYPYGKNGKVIVEKLKQANISSINIVDNYINQSGICDFDYMVKNIAENDVCIVTSENIEILSDVCLAIDNKIINIKNVFELYGKYPYSGWCDLRVKQLLFCAEEIYRNEVNGSVAEAGVYKGDFAQYINAFFPGRKCYLFDSFNGFKNDCVVQGKDNVEECDEWIDNLKDTSVNLVMRKMKYRDKVIIKNGFIPDTFADINDIFCFVNLDMDLYEPTKQALLWFWPRMSKRGVIFVHDFLVWEGIEAAVREFCNEMSTGYIRLMDDCSVAIIKQ